MLLRVKKMIALEWILDNQLKVKSTTPHQHKRVHKQNKVFFSHQVEALLHLLEIYMKKIEKCHFPNIDIRTSIISCKFRMVQYESYTILFPTYQSRCTRLRVQFRINN